MATFKDRALTIATAGLLSATPVTIASQGIIQLEEAVVPVTPIVQPARAAAGGPITIDYIVPLRVEYREFFNFTFIDRSIVDFNGIVLTHALFVDKVQPALFIGDKITYSTAVDIAEEDLFIFVETGKTDFASVPVIYDHIDFTVIPQDRTDYAFPKQHQFKDDVAWKLFSDTVSKSEVEGQIKISGDRELALPVLAMRTVMR